ncbi:hypothetical protein MMC20_006657 [Loxospora ochrophaea]|nr:hypothetical protein [Loxospora ochrophaea]
MTLETGELTQGAIVAGIFACGTCPIELDAANAADIILRHIPSPRGHGVPLPYSHLHDNEKGEISKAKSQPFDGEMSVSSFVSA